MIRPEEEILAAAVSIVGGGKEDLVDRQVADPASIAAGDVALAVAVGGSGTGIGIVALIELKWWRRRTAADGQVPRDERDGDADDEQEQADDCLGLMAQFGLQLRPIVVALTLTAVGTAANAAARWSNGGGGRGPDDGIATAVIDGEVGLGRCGGAEHRRRERSPCRHLRNNDGIGRSDVRTAVRIRRTYSSIVKTRNKWHILLVVGIPCRYWWYCSPSLYSS